MEAVPRLPMISFQLKISPETTTFGLKLKQYIRDFYNEDPESYTNEIDQLENLRTMAIRPPIDVSGCTLLKKYYCQLHFLQSRFPMGKEGAAALNFTWKHIYANMVCSLASIRFEIISILYNIGALHTQLGSQTERTSAEGMKVACTHFQCAAWAFEHLKSNFPQPSGIDLAPELMTFMHQLCLAQAQECILEKSMLDNRKPTIVAKVAKQIVDYFSIALNTLEQGNTEEGTITDIIGAKVYKSWKRYVKFKRAYHLAVTHLYQGLTAEEQRKMGERVAFYNAAAAALAEAQNIYANSKGMVGITGVPKEKIVIEEALTFTNDVIEGKRKAAKNENEFIYHEEVPEKDTLPVVMGASLVKGISFNINDPEVSGPDIFARLVPMKVHEASSMYSEEKAKILRNVGGKIDEKDQQLNLYLTSLKLDHLNLWDPDAQTSEWERLPLPDELIERCAALNAKPSMIQDLLDVMENLTSTSQDVEKVLKEIKMLLLEEEAKEKRYQETVGKRPPSIVATDLTREAKKYEEAHNKALESNTALQKAITMHVKNLRILAQPLSDLVAQIPSPTAALLEQNSEKSQSRREMEQLHVKELKRILNKVDEMRKQRNELHTQLREAIAQDDLTRLLVTATSESGPLDRLFSDHLRKHQSVVKLIEQNLVAQDNILTALTDAYAQTGDVRKSVEDVLKRREIMVSSLISSYDAYEDLIVKCNKGLDFYRKLEINVSKLLQRVKSTCKVQDEEREQILAQDIKNTAGKSHPAVSTYESPRSTTSSGLKLKDYLKNRVDGTSYQNQYYNLKDVSDPTLLGRKPDSYTGAMSNISSMPVSTPQQIHNYYPGPKLDSAYTYDHKDYVDQAGSMNDSNMLNQGMSNLPSQHYTGVAPQTVMDNAAIYPTANIAPSVSQGYYVPMVENQTKYIPQENISQYKTPMDYSTYNPAISQNPSMGNQYNSVNTVKVNVSTPSNVELTSQIQNLSIAAVTGSDSSVNNMPSSLYTQPQYSNVQPYMPQQNNDVGYSAMSNIPNQQVIPSQSNIPVQSYSQPISNEVPYPQQMSNEVPYSQQYQQIYSKPSDVIPSVNQQMAGHSVSVANNYVPSEYLQTQNIAMKQNLSINMTSHLTNPTSVTPSGSGIYSNPSDSMSNQYVQQNPDVSYSAAGSSSQHSAVSTNYSSIYSNYQQNIAGQTYDQGAVPLESHNYGIVPDVELVQSHTKSASIQNYSNIYQYQQGHYTGYVQPQQYTQDYVNQYRNTVPETYKPETEYNYNISNQTYMYAPNQLQSQADVTTSSNYEISTNNTLYTDSNTITTPSDKTPESYQSPVGQETYYTVQYGLQMQQSSQASAGVKTENSTNYNQTYMQATDNTNKGTNTTHSSNPVKSTTKTEIKSNVDLLSDLDITINHAPLVPEVRSIIKKEEEELAPEILEPKNDVSNGVEMNTTSVDDKNENLQIVWDTWYNDVQPKKDPLGDPATLQKFISDVEKYEKFIDSLLVKTLSGATNLDIKWKEVQAFEERENEKQSSTVALAHSAENRVTECIPYDTTRVQLKNAKSSYINATQVSEITQWIPTAFIVTQTPLPGGEELFWTMIWEQDCEVIACLTPESQLSGETYWPISEGTHLAYENFTVSLTKMVNHATYIQRVLSLRNLKEKTEKSVVHMHFLKWPTSGFPNSPGPLLGFSTDVLTEHALRHCSPKPIVIHCLDGSSLSSLFLVAAATVCHIRAGCGIVDVPLVFKGLLKCRKKIVNKESLLFAYRMVLYHAQDILMKRGILSSTRSSFENFDGSRGMKDKFSRKMHHPSDDFLKLCVNNQRTDREQGAASSTNTNTINNTTTQDKSKGSAIDPLSQLDPLWSIRR